MSEHRPECIYTPGHFDPEQNIVWGGKPCICEEIKRAEKRVRDVARQAVEAELGWEEADPSDDFTPHTAIWKFRALAAIDAIVVRNETTGQKP